MWSTLLSSVPLNTLTYNSLKQVLSSDTTLAFDLPFHTRQDLVNLATRERLPLPSRNLVPLIHGGLRTLDLWSLADLNNYSTNEIVSILTTLSNNSTSLRELSIGGSNWIYNQKIVKGPTCPLKKLLSSDLVNLRKLCIQELPVGDYFIDILKSAPNLVSLEISQPSINDKDIVRIESEFIKVGDARYHLKELRLPSSLRKAGILKLISFFKNLQSIKVGRFEIVMDILEEDHIYNETYQMQVIKAGEILKQLKSLIVTHPMGEDSISRLVKVCPELRSLSIEVQDGMILAEIKNLDKLSQLELRNSPTLSTSYLQEVVPLLQHLAHQLDILSLEQFDVLDLTVLARLCPNLTSFSAQWFTILSVHGQPSLTISREERKKIQNPFVRLNKLRLKPRSGRNVPLKAVRFLLSSCQELEILELYSCMELNDKELKRIKSRNQFKYLRSLILRHGHEITRSALQETVGSSPLEFLDVCRPKPSKAELVSNNDE